MIELGIFIGGVVLGVLIVRYGIGLGAKQVFWQKEDIEPFSPEDTSVMEQTHTGNRDFEKET